jgi:hypothetical protein
LIERVFDTAAARADVGCDSHKPALKPIVVGAGPPDASRERAERKRTGDAFDGIAILRSFCEMRHAYECDAPLFGEIDKRLQAAPGFGVFVTVRAGW